MGSIETVKQLEVELHRSAVRSDAKQLDILVHDPFWECGRTGRNYTRNDILEALSKEKAVISVWSQDFAAKEIAEAAIWLTYLSAHIDPDGELSGHTFRSPLWKKSAQGWQVKFHQGTPIDAFVQRTS